MMMMIYIYIYNLRTKNTFIQTISVDEETKKGKNLKYLEGMNLKCNSKFGWTEFNL